MLRSVALLRLTGARSLAEASSSNHTIRELLLYKNPITVDGALLIMKSAVDNTVCQQVRIDYEHMNYDIKKMMDILEDRRKYATCKIYVLCNSKSIPKHYLIGNSKLS